MRLARYDAQRFGRVWGIAVSLKREEAAVNTSTPTPAHVVLRTKWWDNDQESYRSFFALTSVWSANYTPRFSSDVARNVVR